MVWVLGLHRIIFDTWGSCRGRGGGGGCSGYLEGPQEVPKISADSGFPVHLGCAPGGYREEGQFILRRRKQIHVTLAARLRTTKREGLRPVPPGMDKR